MAKQKLAKRAKAGQSKGAAAERRVKFAEAFLSNGGNALQAAIAAGFSPKTAGSQGSRLLKNVEVSAIIDSRRTAIVSDLGLNTDRLVKEISRIAFSDPRNIMHPDGKIKMPHELDADTAAAISSFEVTFDGSIKYKFWDKNSAQERASKVIGLFEKDNKQKADPLTALLESLSGNVIGVAKGGNDD